MNLGEIKCPESKIDLHGGTLEIKGGFRLCCVGLECKAFPCEAVKDHHKKAKEAAHARSG